MLRQLGLPLLHGAFQIMIFMALLQSGVSAVHAINERIAGYLADRGRRNFSPSARLACTSVLLVVAIFAAQQFGLVDLIAKGYRALAWMILVTFVLPFSRSACGGSPRGVPRPPRVPEPVLEPSMRHLIAALLIALPAFAVAAPPKNFDARVEAVMKASEVPGAAVAIVENGKVTLARGYGVRPLGSPRAGRRRHAVPDRLDHQGLR